MMELRGGSYDLKAVRMCSYSYQYDDSGFLVGDTVILVIQRHEREKRQMDGKILSKW